jgi:hypothetical protein
MIDKCFLVGSELFSSRAWVTALRRAGRETQALPRSLHRRTSVAAPMRAPAWDHADSNRRRNKRRPSRLARPIGAPGRTVNPSSPNCAKSTAQQTPRPAAKPWRPSRKGYGAANMRRSARSGGGNGRRSSRSSPSPRRCAKSSTPRMRSTSGFFAAVLFVACASDLVAKGGASAASTAGSPIRSLPD